MLQSELEIDQAILEHDAGARGPVSPEGAAARLLLKEWLRRARLLEITAFVQLAKDELARRGIALTYAISQTDPPSDATPPTASRG